MFSSTGTLVPHSWKVSLFHPSKHAVFVYAVQLACLRLSCDPWGSTHLPALSARDAFWREPFPATVAKSGFFPQASVQLAEVFITWFLQLEGNPHLREGPPSPLAFSSIVFSSCPRAWLIGCSISEEQMVTFVVTWHSFQGDRDEKVPGHYLTHIHSCYIWQNRKTFSSLHRTELFSKNQTQSWLTPNTNGQLRFWERWNLYAQQNLWDDVVADKYTSHLKVATMTKFTLKLA